MAESNKINLLICTQKVDQNDPVLGFFHEWLKEFAKYCDKLTVICLEKGEYDLPQNVQVLSLGKEKRISRIVYIFKFYYYIWKYSHNYDSVFVHMNPEYICLGGLFWRFWRKKIALWYMHRNVDLKLRIAEKLTNLVFSATRDSFRLKTKKLKITGHGINVDQLPYKYHQLHKDRINFINIGRLSSIKGIENLIEFAKKIKEKNINFIFKVVGDFSNKEYENKIKALVRKYNLENEIIFIGSVSNLKIGQYLQESDFFIHTGKTTSLDKSILEAMSTGTFVFTNVLSSSNILIGNNLELLTYNNIDKLVNNFDEFVLLEEGERKNISLKLRNIVLENHNLKNLIKNLIENL